MSKRNSDDRPTPEPKRAVTEETARSLLEPVVYLRYSGRFFAARLAHLGNIYFDEVEYSATNEGPQVRMYRSQYEQSFLPAHRRAQVLESEALGEDGLFLLGCEGWIFLREVIEPEVDTEETALSLLEPDEESDEESTQPISELPPHGTEGLHAGVYSNEPALTPPPYPDSPPGSLSPAYQPSWEL
jgi:hypothetical protein